MAKITYDKVIDHLYEAFPDVQVRFRQMAKELYGEHLPHVVYGDVLVEYVQSLAKLVEAYNDGCSSRRLLEVFGLIEELANIDDFEIGCLVQTGFLEGLLKDSKQLQRFVEYMGPKTREFANLVNK